MATGKNCLISKLQRVFKHENFRGEQEEIIRLAIEGGHSLVLMPTGMGKSLCYQFPALELSGGGRLVLVLSPLVALMQDQVEKARSFGISATAINSSLSKEEREERQAKISQGEFQLLFVTPERFRKPEFIEVIQSRKISLLAVDEAHCISQWGHDFRPDYSRLGEIREKLGNPPVMALTATATPQVQKDILNQLHIPDAKIFSSGIERPNLQIAIQEVYGIDDKIRSIVGLRHLHQGSAIIYFSLIGTLIKVSKELHRMGFPHLTYHGDLSAQERRKNQNRFIAEPNRLMLATPAFGLGVDKPDVRMVVHAEIPNSIESYYQEIGRAGRDGMPSDCILLYDHDDVSIQMEFIKWANPEAEFINQVYLLIEKNKLRLEQEGMDFLRKQLNFYNSRDFRVETSVNLLHRWGCLQEDTSTKFGYTVVQPPTLEQLDAEKVKARIKTQNEKLLQMVRLAEAKSGWLDEIYKYLRG